MPITLGNTTIAGLGIGGLPAGTVNAASLATSGAWAPSGTVIAVNTVRNSTRTSQPISGTRIIFDGTFTKLRADTIIIATCTVFGAGYSSGNCGVGLRLNTTWDFGTAYQYDGSWSQTDQTTIVCGTGRWTGVAAGSNTIGFGFQPVNGSTSERPFNFLNPNSSDDIRNQQMTSSIVIYEVAP